jgi:hypothetical protein
VRAHKGFEMSDRTRVRLILACTIVVFFSIMLVLMGTRGGSLAGVIRIKNFTLCQVDNANGAPRPLTSLIFTPTTVIHACGYLEVSLIYPSKLCFAYEVLKQREAVFRPYTEYCVPWRSQYFSFPVTTTELLVPGTYELFTYTDAARDRPASVYFEIRPNSK